MDHEKTQDLLLQLIKDMSYVKAKLDNLDEQKLSSRLDLLEAQNREHERVIKSLERRNDTMEQFTRNQMSDSKKQMMSVYISIGLAIFSGIFSFVLNLI